MNTLIYLNAANQSPVIEGKINHLLQDTPANIDELHLARAYKRYGGQLGWTYERFKKAWGPL